MASPSKSFIEVLPTSHFPIQNIPFGVFRPSHESKPRVGTAIGDFVLDLSVLAEEGFFSTPTLTHDGKCLCFHESSLNLFMSLGKKAWTDARSILQLLLSDSNPTLRDNQVLRARAFHPIQKIIMELPAHIGDYTDFYASKEHASNLGIMMRGKDNPLLPNWVHIPVGYHGRSSSVVLSGTKVRRPNGQTKADDAPLPTFGPSKMLDFELEIGFFVGTGNNLGEPLPVGNIKDHIFGMVLLNDWSARDLQKWEYVPLGPFLAKNFATSISAWVVTLDALEPFLVDGPLQDPLPLPYLQETPGKNTPTNYNIDLSVFLKSPKAESAQLISHTNFKYMYYSVFQQLAHHSSNGCNMRPGDLCGTGTISGPTEDSYGSLIELTWRGSKPLKLNDGTERKFLNDGDTLIMTGVAKGDGYQIGFGECVGTITPAL
eukprot:TRINITY_DN4423_c0_g2_i1.p1 TRINITY_DN4423_c0_g2~~TRINITY_DN4423_c0_g2_i1.p1  ORF type:complete len:430 (-),score=90.96 TRINITY_DN4423_c0_g2_i1:237-1526(-)